MLNTKPIVNFSGGECSPSLYGRSDTVPYYAMGKKLENVIVSHYGSVSKTSGTVHVARTKTMSENSRLIEFIYSSGSSYIIEMGDLYMRFYRDSGSIVEDAVVITGITKADPCVITTSTAHAYSDGDYVDLSGIVGMTELNNRRVIISNSTSNTFEITDEDAVDVDSTGYTTYSSSGESEKIFEIVTPYLHTELADIKFTQQADVMWITHANHTPYKLSRTASTVFSIAAVEFDATDYPPFLSIDSSDTTITPSSTTGSGITLTASTAIWTSDYVGSFIQMTHAATTGFCKVTGFTDTTHLTATVLVDFGATTASSAWYDGAWSEVQGYPTDCKFYEQRLYYSATATKPLTVWGSRFGAFDDFEQGSDDDDSVAYTLGSSQVDRIRWMYPTSVLNCGTAGGPFTLSSGSQSLPITATNISVKQQNENGTSNISPVRIGSFVYYTERSDKILGQFSYTFDYDSYDTEDITYLSDHILGDGVADMALARYPYNILWCVRNDGKIATLTRQIKNDVKGWSRQIPAGTDAKAKSIAVIPNGVEDQVWEIVERTINEGTTKYVEYVKPFDHYSDQADAWFVQSGIEYNSTAATVISGLEHLEGESVQVLTDGAIHPNKTVTDGSITLEWSAEHVILGLGYTATIETMDIDTANAQQTSQAKVTHIGKVSIRFLNSLGCKFGDGTTTDVIPFRDSSMDMDSPPPLFTGDKEVEFPSAHAKNKYIFLYQEQQLPMTILGIYPRMLISS